MTPPLVDKKLNILIAYPYLVKTGIDFLLERQDQFRFVLDSGAFTAWKAGNEIKLDDYCRFIESLPFTPWRYFTLDVIGDADKTVENYEIMLSRGFKPVPIFTRGEKIEMLDEYYKTSDIVALGGLVGTRGNKGFVNGLMKHIAGRKCHLLGFTSIDYLKEYKPYMCDSSSWKSAMRYGDVYIYMGGGVFEILKKPAFRTRPSELLIHNIERCGFKASDLAKTSEWSGGGGVSHRLTVCSWILFMMEVRKNLGIEFFLASGGRPDLKMALTAYDHLTKQGLL